MISLRSGVWPERRSPRSLPRRMSFGELSALPNQGKNSHQRSKEPCACACAPIAAIDKRSPSDTAAKILARAPRVTSLLCDWYIVAIDAADDLLCTSPLVRIIHEHNAYANRQKTLALQRLWKSLTGK